MKDDLLRAPVTYALILINIAVYALASYQSLFLVAQIEWIDAFSFTPAMLLYPGDWYRLITSMFMHVNFVHILFNMYFLYIFGRDVEERMGSFRYLVFYLVSGILASIFHSGLIPLTGSIAVVIPSVGASGAISGVLGAYLMMFPARSMKACMVIPVPLCITVNAARFLIFWLLLQVGYGILSYGTGGGGVAFFAHIGGFISGILIAFLLTPRRQLKVSPPPWALVEVVVSKEGLPAVIKALLVFVMLFTLGGAIYSALVAENLKGIYVFTLTTKGAGVVESDEGVYSLADNRVIAPASSGPRVVFNRLIWSDTLVGLANTHESGVLFNEYVEIPGSDTPIRITIVGDALYDERGVLRSLKGVVITDVILVSLGRVVGVERNVRYDVEVESRDIAEESGALVVRVTAMVSALVTILSTLIATIRDDEIAEEKIEVIYTPNYPWSTSDLPGQTSPSQ